MERWDVIVAGAGPAGSTAAALLADAGQRVLVIEKEPFPRFRIGESLLPACLPVLERLGIETPPDTFVRKSGAEFVDEDEGTAGRFSFAEALPGCADHAWHVERARFDRRLLDRALVGGAEARHGAPVEAVEPGADAVRVRAGGRTEEARYLLDATGQGRLLARRMEGVRHYEGFGTSSVYTHFEGAGAAYDEVFGEANDIRILIRPEGWGWIIPLPEHRLSIGLVSRGKVAREDLDRGILAGPLASRLTAGARRLGTRVVGNFGYVNTVPAGPRFGCVGDAACFLDPVFSSGVTLALRGAEAVADTLAPALAAGTEGAPDLLDEPRRSMDRAYRTFESLIERFYHGRFAASFFLRSMPDYELRRGILSVLAGDVWRTDNPFQDMLLRGRRVKPAVGEPA